MTEADSSILRGTRWIGLSTAVSHTLHLGASIVLARILWPQDFGVFAASLALTQFCVFVSDLGLGAALVRARETDRSLLDSSFWACFLGSAGIAAVIATTATPLARLVGNPSMAAILPMLAAVIPLHGIAVVPLALLNRHLRFRGLAAVDVFGTMSQAAAALMLAALGFGVLALVAGQIARQTTVAVAAFALTGFKPGFLLSRKAVLDLLPFAGPVWITGLAATYLANIDVLLVGRYLGTTTLGLYNRASFLVRYPGQLIGGVIQRASFPSISQAAENRHEVRDVFLKMLSAACAIGFSAVAGLYGAGPSLILALFGDRWAEAIPLLHLLCPLGVLIVIDSISISMLWGRGRPDKWMVLELFSVPVLTLALWLGLDYGSSGAILGVTLHAALRTCLNLWITSRELRCGAAQVFLRFWPGALAAASVLLTHRGISLAIEPESHPWSFLCVAIPLGLIVSLATIRFAHPTQFVLLQQIAREFLRPVRTG